MKWAWDWAVQWLLVSKGKGIFFLLYFLMPVFLLALKKRKHAFLFAWYELIFLILYFTPPIAWVILRFIGEGTYWRMFWVLPIPAVLAFGGAVWVGEQKNLWGELLTLAIVVLVIGLSGTNIWTHDAYSKAANLQKLSPETIEISNLLEVNAGEDETIMICLPEELNCEIRQFNARIRQPYGRRIDEYPQYRELCELMHEEHPDAAKLAGLLREAGCNYAAHAYSPYLAEELSEQGFELLGIVGNYLVFAEI